MDELKDITVLVVEDDNTARRLTNASLKKAGFKVIEAASGEDALSMAKQNRPEVIVLDILLPGINGFEVCKKLQDMEIDSIIIMLTSKSEDMDVIHGLDIGGDDYLVKPCNHNELIARIKAILRRWQHVHKPDDVLGYRNIRIDYKQLKAYKDGEELDLTPREITLLSVFLQNQGKLLTRQDLYSNIYGEDHYGTIKVIDVYVRRLREKVEDDPQEPVFLKTVWGRGYVCGDYDA
jgi:DNA-binding response OmpR family regulator